MNATILESFLPWAFGEMVTLADSFGQHGCVQSLCVLLDTFFIDCSFYPWAFILISFTLFGVVYRRLFIPKRTSSSSFTEFYNFYRVYW